MLDMTVGNTLHCPADNVLAFLFSSLCSEA